MPIAGTVKINLVDLIDHLTEESSVFHVVVGVLKYGSDDLCLGAEGDVEVFEGRE